jgi:hypothetical protein
LGEGANILRKKAVICEQNDKLSIRMWVDVYGFHSAGYTQPSTNPHRFFEAPGFQKWETGLDV